MKVFTFPNDRPGAHANVSVDSAVRLRNEPFFAPDGRQWAARLFAGARIDRLGLAVAPKFARRYYSALTVLAHPFVEGDNVEYEFSRDAAIMHNADIKLSDIPESISVSVTGDATFSTEISAEDLCRRLDSLLSEVSRCHTLKTGDIVALPLGLPLLPMAARADYFVDVAGVSLVHLKSR